ncbi:NACHT domain-containing protein [Micromonospora tulbaghiae]|uniref:NACHT domain-containing protein n=1 Tax=Micromonospora tulbaghiae TaxID=479978 RepID=UPI0036A54A42
MEPLIALRIGKPIVNLLARLAGVAPRDPAGFVSDFSEIADQLAPRWAERNRVRRRLEDAAEKVAERMADFIKAEFRDAQSNDIEAAIHAVSASLGLAITDSTADLVPLVVDPDAFAAHLHTIGARQIRDGLYSSEAESIFDVLLSETATYLADISLNLPDFTPQALRAVLRQGDQFQALVLEALDNLPARLRAERSFDRDAISFLRKYRDSIARRFDVLELAGVDLEVVRKRYQLTPAYVALSLRSELSDGISEIGETSIESLLQQHSRLLIVGEPGSGKSTILKWIAVSAVRDNFTSSLENWNGRIPFVVKLRSMRDGQLPKVSELADTVSAANEPFMPENWCHDVLKRGRGVLLVDGLDEISREVRGRVHAWIEEMAATYKSTPVIVTTRPAALRELPFDVAAFARAHILPMSLPQLNLFIDYWHSSVLRVEQLADGDGSPKQIGDALRQRLYSDRELRLLANNPLLCAVICALHVGRRQSLPNSRKEIYRAALEMLLKRRDDERGIPTLPLSPEEKQSLLMELAHRLTLAGKSEISIGESGEVLSAAMRLFRGEAAAVRPQTLLNDLVSRSGLLRFPSEGMLEFAHRSFQEYLTAEFMVRERYLSVLSSRFDDAEWQQVIAWSLSFMGQEDSNKFCAALLDAVRDSAGDRRLRLIILALACSENALYLDPETRSEIETLGAELAPPSHLDAVSALVGIGDAAIPLLAQGLTPQIGQVELELTVDALIRIGGDDALAVLSSLPAETRERVARRLAGGWAYFEPSVYARTVLADVPVPEGRPCPVLIRDPALVENARWLSAAYVLSAEVDASRLGNRICFTAAKLALVKINRIPSAGWLKKALNGLQAANVLLLKDPIDLSVGDALLDSEGIGAISKLRIEAGNECMVDLAILAMFPNLESVEIVGRASLHGVDMFASMSRLQSVRLALDEVSSSMGNFVGNFKSLEILSWPARDLTALRFLDLKELAVRDSSRLESLDGLRRMSNLSVVDVSGCERLTSCGALRELPSLASVDLSNCVAFVDRELVEELSDYVEVNLEGSGVASGFADVEPELLPERWLLPELETMDSVELYARGWDESTYLLDETRDEYEDIWPEPTTFSPEGADRHGYIIIDRLDEWESSASEDCDVTE